MLFNSAIFFLFLAIVLPVYYALSRRAQNFWLLVASYVFYGYWDWRFLSLLAISTVVDYVCGLKIESAPETRVRKRFLLLSVAANLGILGFFKYFNFFTGSAEALLDAFGLKPSFPLLQIVLPVGISFYTFQTMSYTIDIYRGKMRPTRDFLTFALYVSYFPQLVAGPIERASRLLPQLLAPRRATWPDVGRGVELMVIGYLKKVGIADAIAPLVDARFSNPGVAGGLDLLLTGFMFGAQIYCDFSGYSDIARGVSKLFGVDLMKNFEQPYLSQSITEFWRRWHVSLSSWLRDYLYIALGGNRQGLWQTYRNLMLTMLLGGLWHGAAWTFVVWGGLHGLYLAVHKFWLSKKGLKAPVVGPLLSARGLLKVFATLNLVTLTWIFFRCASFQDAWTYLARVFTWASAEANFAWTDWITPRFGLLLALMVAIDAIQNTTGRHTILLRKPWPLRSLAYASLIFITFALGGLDEQVPFIYFQF